MNRTKIPSPAPRNLAQVRRELSKNYAELRRDPRAHDRVRLSCVVMGRLISTVTASVAYHHLSKTKPSKSLDRFVRG